MKASLKHLRLLAFLGLLAATLGLLRAEDTASSNDAPPAAPVAEQAPATPVEPPDEPAVEPADKPDELRSLTPTEPITSTEPAAEEKKAEEPKQKKLKVKADVDAEIPFGNITIEEGHNAKEAVSVFGSTTVKGSVDQDAVAIFGHNRIAEGARVGHDAVAVFGHLFVDGEVNHDTVAVFGNIHFGPKAVSKGQTVVVFGQIIKAEGAQTGPTQSVMSFPGMPDFSNMGAWAQDCLLKGRLLSFNHGSEWAWAIAGAHLLFYLILALVLRGPLTRCTETLEKRPGMSLLSTFLVFILTPLIVIILAIGTITAVLIPIYIVGLFFLGIFGRAVMHAFFGRLVTRFIPGNERLHIALSVLIGGVIISLFYCVPLAAFLIHSLIGSIGLGAVVLAITERMKREPKAPKPAAGTPPAPAGTAAPAAPLSLRPAPTTSAAFSAQDSTPAAEPPILSATEIPAPLPAANEPAPALNTPILPGAPSFSAPSSTPAPAPLPAGPAPAASAMAAADSALPRAGFWLRMGALAIDLLLVIMLCGFASSLLPFLHMGPWLFIALATYGALLWKHRGTTVGGTICRIQVVRTDDAPMDWNTAVVRALGCILSAFAAGLGFIWIAVDRDQEAWHDKISGTAVVRVPKTRPMV